MIIIIAKAKALLLTSIVQSIGLLSMSAMIFHLALMKLLAILVILYRSAHWNNSNYFPLPVAIYLYLAGVKVDAITLLNCLGLSILYYVLLKRLRSIILARATFIKQQVTHCKLVGT